MEEQIRRSDAIEAIRERHPVGGRAMASATLSQCESVNRWIPVMERLPKEKETVLTCDQFGCIDFGRYDKGLWYWEAEACADYWARNDGVTAWMPLPTPYKGGDSE